MIQNPNRMLRVGLIGTVAAALCCATPLLAVLLGAVGLAAFTGYLDYVLMPALVAFVGLTIYALQRKRQAVACCNPGAAHSQGGADK